MADIDAVIRKCVDDIWAEYDKDGSGSLDKEETKKFVKNTLSEMNDSGEFSEADFEACFKEFDKDGSGYITKGDLKCVFETYEDLFNMFDSSEFDHLIAQADTNQDGKISY